MASITDYTDDFTPYNGMRATSQWRTGSTLVLLVIAAPLFLFSCIRDEYNHFVDRQQMNQAQKWPSTPAEISDCGVRPEQISQGRGSGITMYHVKVDCKYTVNGTEHFSTQDKFLDRAYTIQPRGLFEFSQPEALIYTAEQETILAQEFAPGTKVTVKYNPVEPEIAYVDTAIAPDSTQDFQRRMALVGFILVSALIAMFIKSGAGKMR